MAALIGLRDIHAALLTSDTSTAVAYEDPVLIAGAINAKVTPTSNSETLYSDDGPSETATVLGEITVELQLAELTMQVQAMLLGHTLANGVLVKKEGDVAPYVAVGFKSQKSNGKYRYVWLYKGKFSLPEQEYATKTDTPQYNTGTISSAFVKRVFDGAWEIDGDEDDPQFSYSSQWFDKVFEAPQPPPPPPPTRPQLTFDDIPTAPAPILMGEPAPTPPPAPPQKKTAKKDDPKAEPVAETAQETEGGA